jgi:hypothetical protein
MSLNKPSLFYGRRHGRSFFLALVLILLAPHFAFNQEPKESKPPATVEKEKDKPGDPYRTIPYDPQNKRDPFKSLIAKKSAPDAPVDPILGKKVPGIRGMPIQEVKLIGLAKGINGEKIAILFGTDQKAHFLYRNDRLLDGYIKDITADSVTFVREVKYLSGNVKREELKVLLYPPVASNN